MDEPFTKGGRIDMHARASLQGHHSGNLTCFIKIDQKRTKDYQ